MLVKTICTKFVTHGKFIHFNDKLLTEFPPLSRKYPLLSHLKFPVPVDAPSHIVRSASKSNEFVQKQDQQKKYPTYMYFKGKYSLKSFMVGFLFFEKSGF